MPTAPGLYESIVTAALARALTGSEDQRPLTPSEASRRLAAHFADHLERALATIPAARRPAAQVALVNELLAVVERHAASFPLVDDAVTDRILTAIPREGQPTPPRPQLPLSESGLYVNANRERSLDAAIRLECESSDRIDLICAFLFWQGYVRIRKVVRRHCEAGRPLRVLTTTYTGVTQARVLDELKALGADVRVSYEGGGTRLHAKAWLFHRDSGFGTALIGSSNLSHTALTSGREWNVRLSRIENRAVFEELEAAFENHWGDEEFVPYERDAFLRTIRAERPTGELRAVFALRPRPFQKAILERLDAERELHGRHRNLVVSATGTGKTVVAALDYARLCGAANKRLKLLFVAHRKEILTQSKDVFCHAMSDGSFGELYVDGLRPLDFTHVFASVQSLRHVDLAQWPRDHFDVVIVDEFHHASAATYQRILDYFAPAELLGLTATPERADGQSVLTTFDGHIAAELRIWDAIDRGLLVPFQYFGIHDGADLTGAWRRGRYDLTAMDGVYTANDMVAHLVTRAIGEHVHDPSQMRALAFCAGVGHATFMARAFTATGIPSAVVTGETKKVDRREAITKLRNGDLACILTVDVFNEGVDIPEIDTVLFLRPTESATVFLQQLGRGLRLAEGKRCLTVLDFVAIPHAEFRYADRYRALLGRMSRRELQSDIEQDFPRLPAGCSIHLDRRSRELVLANVAASLRLDRRALAAELKDSGEDSLAGFLHAAGLELSELYKGGRCFSELRRLAGLPTGEAGPSEAVLARGLGRLLHVDDPPRLEAWTRWLQGGSRPGSQLRAMLLTTLLGPEAAGALDQAEATVRRHPAIVAELLELLAVLAARLDHLTLPFVSEARLPLQVHATYRLNEVMAALSDVRQGRLYLPREGVHFDPSSRCNLLFVTLHKDEEDYSPTTMYADYALGPDRFHWQSQSGTRPQDKKGQRHVAHDALRITPLLFIRPQKKDDRGETVAYTFLGPVRLLRSEGERPMNIEWGLDVPMPAEILQVARVVR